MNRLAVKAEEQAVGRGLSLARIVLLLVLLAALLGLGRVASAHLQELAAWLSQLGPWGPIAFIAGYAAATVAFVPGSLLTLAAGAIFGLSWGILYVFVGATIGSSAAFLVSRYLARATIERRLAGNDRFAAIDRAIAAEGLKVTLLLRLSPVFPFNLLNYGLGLTKVRFVDYLVASMGMLPGTLLYVYYGKLAGDVAGLAAGAQESKGAAYWAVLILGLLATLAVTAIVTRLARRALPESTSGGSR
ncbi:MAG: TVP38/TMEM64 family protein [Acidobacteria bacterium]|nr:TVP38/TMEM64 family protein [Acidobacteriota bacterium]